MKSVYPVLMTEKIDESCEFYKRFFAFTEEFSTDWYVSLRHPDGNEIAFIDVNHDTIPERSRANVEGMILNIEVDNVSTIYSEIVSKSEDSSVIFPLQDEAYGQRHFMLIDPNDVIIDVIEEIEPSEEFLANYK